MKFNWNKYLGYTNLVMLLFKLKVADTEMVISKLDTVKSNEAKFFCDE